MLRPDDPLDSFRRDTAAWLQENFPAALRAPMPQDEVPWGGRKSPAPSADAAVWLQRMADRGWTAPTWPTAYGGGGLSLSESQVLQAELARIGARPALVSFGVMMLGPVLLEFGSEAQKARFLPPTARGEIRWCQGYSEPGAGSDLASLRMRCEDRGDHFLVNGQKVWTSYADKADWAFCLVRTSTETKHGGISFLLIDMESEGIEVRPIPLISGASPFCETFFSDVRVPKDQLVGSLHGGWPVAKRLLQYERQGISSGQMGALGDAWPLDPVAVARERVGLGEDGRLRDPDLRTRIVAVEMDHNAFVQTVRRAQTETGPNAASSILKYAMASISQRRCELEVEALGLEGVAWEDAGAEGDQARVRRLLRSKAFSIEGGTSEINLNIVARRVLGLGGGD